MGISRHTLVKCHTADQVQDLLETVMWNHMVILYLVHIFNSSNCKPMYVLAALKCPHWWYPKWSYSNRVFQVNVTSWAFNIAVFLDLIHCFKMNMLRFYYWLYSHHQVEILYLLCWVQQKGLILIPGPGIGISPSVRPSKIAIFT